MSVMYSFVVPTYNNEKDIEKCLLSIVRQPYPNKEVLVIDDGSSDNTFIIVMSLSRRYKYIKLLKQQNSGPNVARNFGIQEARGDYCLFVDADDFIDEDLLETVNRELVVKDWDIINYGFSVTRQGGSLLHKKKFSRQEIFGLNIFIEALTGKKYSGVCWNKCIKRSLLVNNNITFLPDKMHGRDILFSRLCAFYATSLLIIPDTIYYSMYRTDSFSRSFSDKNVLSALDLCDKHYEVFSNKGVEIAEYLKVATSRHLRYILLLSSFRAATYSEFKNHIKMIAQYSAFENRFGDFKQLDILSIISIFIQNTPLLWWYFSKLLSAFGIVPY